MTKPKDVFPSSVLLECASAYWHEQIGIEVSLSSLSSPELVSDSDAQTILEHAQKFSSEYNPEVLRIDERHIAIHGTNMQLMAGINIGQRIHTALEPHGIRPFNYGFIDSTELLERAKISSESWRFASVRGRQTDKLRSLYAENGLGLDLLREEGDLIPLGLELVEKIKDSSTEDIDLTLDGNGEFIIVKTANGDKRIRLMGYGGKFQDWRPDAPSCEVLDATSYIEKLGIATVAITVLPNTFRSQQARVMKLLEIADVSTDVVDVFHGSSGDVGKVKPWTESLKPFADWLKLVLKN